MIFFWRDFLRVQLLVAIVAALLVWLGLSKQFTRAVAPPSGQSLAAGVRALLRNPAFLAVSLADGLMAMARGDILTFFPLYIDRPRPNAFELGVYVALLHGMGTVSQPVLGVLADRVGRKAVLVPSFLILTGLYLLLGRVAPGWPLGVVVLVIGMFFYTLVNITARGDPRRGGGATQSSATGLSSVLTQLIALPSPVLGAACQHFGYAVAFHLAAGFMVVGTLVMLPVRLYRGADRPGA